MVGLPASLATSAGNNVVNTTSGLLSNFQSTATLLYKPTINAVSTTDFNSTKSTYQNSAVTSLPSLSSGSNYNISIPSLGQIFPLFTGLITKTMTSNSWSYISSSYTAKAGDALVIDTTNSSVNLVAPYNPNVGDGVCLTYYGGNNATINFNGQKYLGTASNVNWKLSTGVTYLIYISTAIGWIATNNLTYP